MEVIIINLQGPPSLERNIFCSVQKGAQTLKHPEGAVSGIIEEGECTEYSNEVSDPAPWFDLTCII